MHTWVLNMNTCDAIQVIACLHIGDEMFSDIYKMKLIGDVLYEVEGKVSKYCDASFICRRSE